MNAGRTRDLERRLTTILSAGIEGGVGPSGIDRVAVAELRSELIEPLVGASGGRIVRAHMQGFEVEFGSVVNAVQFAVDLQQSVDRRNAELSEEHRQRFRIGINLWDMFVEGNDVFGDGVNVANRLQSVAEPGSIMITETVHEHVHRHLPLIFEDAGSRQLKDAPGLIPTFRVTSRRLAESVHSAAQAVQASVAVLPFVNVSEDPEQDYLSDGLTEGIAARLSRISALFVVSRNLGFTVKSISHDLSHLALRLGVQYLLQGSVRRVADRVIIAAELADGHINRPLWSQRYDCGPDGIFALQDNISRDVVQALHLRIEPGEREVLHQRATCSSEAYRFYLMGRSYIRRGRTRRLLRLAKQMFQRAVEMSPDYAAAHAGIADCNSHLLEAGDFSVTTDDIIVHSNRAIDLDPSLAEAYASRGLALYTLGRYDDARASFEQAIALGPDLFEAYYFYARNCFNVGQFAKAADLFGHAAKLRRDDFRALGMQSMCFQALAQLGEARTAARSALARTELAVAERPDEGDALSFGAGLLAFLGEYNRTKDWAQRALIVEPDDFYINYNIACAYALLGAKEEAMDLLERIMQPPTPRSQWEHMVHDCDLDTLRDHPRYRSLLNSLGLS